jgi:hypothetical protein
MAGRVLGPAGRTVPPTGTKPCRRNAATWRARPEPEAPPGEGGEGRGGGVGGQIVPPFFKRRPDPCLLELSARSSRAGLWFSAGPASGPARVDPSKPGNCALGGSDGAESAAPPSRAGLTGLLRWRVSARPGQREVGAANCAPASCAARPPWISRAADSAPRARGPGVCIGPAAPARAAGAAGAVRARAVAGRHEA